MCMRWKGDGGAGDCHSDGGAGDDGDDGHGQDDGDGDGELHAR